MANNFFQNYIFTKFVNCNIEMLARRLYAPSFEDVARLEDAQRVNRLEN